MSKTRLIERLQWYYPIEKFHAFVTFPVLLIYLLFTNPIKDLILLSYGLIVCIFILYQGQYYWKLKLNRLKGKYVEQNQELQFFKRTKRFNKIWIAGMLPIFIIQLYIQNWNLVSNDMFIWGIVANVFAILEHINYYHVQLMIDNKYDVAYVIKNKQLKKASLAKDLMENKI